MNARLLECHFNEIDLHLQFTRPIYLISHIVCCPYVKL